MDNIEEYILYNELGKEQETYLRTQPNLETAWNNCTRGEWLLEMTALWSVDHKTLVRVMCYIVRNTPINDNKIVWHYMQDTSQRAIETTEAWLTGSASIEEVHNAEADTVWADAVTNAKANAVESAVRTWAEATICAADAANALILVAEAHMDHIAAYSAYATAYSVIDVVSYAAAYEVEVEAHANNLTEWATEAMADAADDIACATARQWQADYIRSQISWSDVSKRLEE